MSDIAARQLAAWDRVRFAADGMLTKQLVTVTSVTHTRDIVIINGATQGIPVRECLPLDTIVTVED